MSPRRSLRPRRRAGLDVGGVPVQHRPVVPPRSACTAGRLGSSAPSATLETARSNTSRCSSPRPRPAGARVRKYSGASRTGPRTGTRRQPGRLEKPSTTRSARGGFPTTRCSSGSAAWRCRCSSRTATATRCLAALELPAGRPDPAGPREDLPRRGARLLVPAPCGVRRRRYGLPHRTWLTDCLTSGQDDSSRTRLTLGPVDVPSCPAARARREFPCARDGIPRYNAIG